MNNSGGQQQIGGETHRIDAYDKVTGRTEYVGDIFLPELLHAGVLRSPHHHARLLALDISTALRVPDMVCVITAEDVPGVNGFPEYSHDEPLLAPIGDTLKTKGAPIALIVAETLEAVRSGLAAIRTEYETLPHSFDTDNEIPIYQGGDRLKDHQVIHGDVEAAFSASETILETRYSTAYQEHAALESESALSI